VFDLHFIHLYITVRSTQRECLNCFSEISVFRRSVVDGIFALLGCYTVYVFKWLPKLIGQTLSPFCDCLTLEKKGQITCPETSANTYQHTLCNTPKERRPQIQIRRPVLSG